MCSTGSTYHGSQLFVDTAGHGDVACERGRGRLGTRVGNRVGTSLGTRLGDLVLVLILVLVLEIAFYRGAH